jgi:hypothetical protein
MALCYSKLCRTSVKDCNNGSNVMDVIWNKHCSQINLWLLNCNHWASCLLKKRFTLYIVPFLSVVYRKPSHHRATPYILGLFSSAPIIIVDNLPAILLLLSILLVCIETFIFLCDELLYSLSTTTCFLPSSHLVSTFSNSQTVLKSWPRSFHLSAGAFHHESATNLSNCSHLRFFC